MIKKRKKNTIKRIRSKIVLLLDEETCPKGRSRNRDIANELETTRTCETEEDWCVEGMSSFRGIWADDFQVASGGWVVGGLFCVESNAVSEITQGCTGKINWNNDRIEPERASHTFFRSFMLSTRGKHVGYIRESEVACAFRHPLIRVRVPKSCTFLSVVSAYAIYLISNERYCAIAWSLHTLEYGCFCVSCVIISPFVSSRIRVYVVCYTLDT